MKSPAFQFYPSDYLSDENVDSMTLEQQGAYWRLCCHAWKIESPLPPGSNDLNGRSTTVGRILNDDQRLSKLARMTEDEWAKNKAQILAAFRIDPDGYITQKRLLREWNKQQEFHQQRIEAGKASAKARAKKPLNERSNDLNDRSTSVQREGNSSSSSSSSSSEEERKRAREGVSQNDEASIPTAAEIAWFGRMGAAIPEDYCQHYHAKVSETHGWVKNGRLIDWRRQVVRWWAGDKPTWGRKGGGGKSTTGPGVKPHVDAVLKNGRWV